MRGDRAAKSPTGNVLEEMAKRGMTRLKAAAPKLLEAAGLNAGRCEGSPFVATNAGT